MFSFLFDLASDHSAHVINRSKQSATIGTCC